MPTTKFDQPKSLADNKGSCAAFVSYLLKEDCWKGIDMEFFFNQNNDMYTNFEVIQSIDKNKLGLNRHDAKFYTGSINFSEQELAFLKNDLSKIKGYTIKVMEEYAKNFNKGLTINDINWYAKIETNRYYKGNDPEVKSGHKKQGDVKAGNNLHVHFIIARKTVNDKVKISPITNHQDTKTGPIKGGFCRDRFYENCERIFDKYFQYNRPFDEAYHYYKVAKDGSLDEKSEFFRQKEERNINREKYHSLNNDEKIARLMKLISYIKFGINKEVRYDLNSEKLLEFEKTYGFDGSVYRSLMNLNTKMKNGYQPTGSLTDLVINYAEYLHSKSLQETGISLSSTDDRKSELNREQCNTQPEITVNYIPSVAQIIQQEEDFDEPLYKRKKKKKNNDLDA